MNANEKVLLTVDLSFQVYRAAASHANLTSAEGAFTGGLYGFLVTLAKTIRETRATHVVVCRDMKPYKRSELYPEYKALRKKNQDDKLKQKYTDSVPMVLEACRVIGLPVVGVPGYEADDIAAHYITRWRHRFTHIYAATNDSDLFQLLWCRRLRIYRKDLVDAVDADSLLRDTGLTYEQYPLASALMGTHNDVEGIPLVGEKTAYKAVKDPGLLRKYQERYANLIARNLRLIKLPYEGFPADLELPSMGVFHHRSLYRFCARYDIEVTSNMLNSFEQVCPT